MKRVFTCLLLLSLVLLNGQAKATTIYLIPGHGSDSRIFNNLNFDTSYQIKHIRYYTPRKGISLRNYALQLSRQIDTTDDFVLIGVSFGGMIASELSEYINPKKVIIISSAKNRNELPPSYRFQNKMPLYKILSPRMAKVGARALQPIVEPDRRNESAIFRSMLKEKDSYFMRRAIEMIIHWEREISPKNIFHIHGNKDHTLPIRNVSFDYRIENGSHMMTLTRAKEISTLIGTILKD